LIVLFLLSQDPSAPISTEPPGVSARGTTPWVKLPVWPRGIRVGDILELYEQQYTEVSRSFEVVALEPENLVIKISPELNSDIVLNFTDGTTQPPFARIRVGSMFDFDTLKGRLADWLARPEDQAQYLSELGRRLNALLVNGNPTAQEIHDFGVLLKRMSVSLTIAGKTAFGAEVVP
jgi:hypothetical protein